MLTLLTYGSAEVMRIFFLPSSGRILLEPMLGVQVERLSQESVRLAFAGRLGCKR